MLGKSFWLIWLFSQVQFRWQVFLASSHQTPDSDNWRIHDSRRPVAGQETKPTQQKGHDVGHLSEQKKNSGRE